MIAAVVAQVMQAVLPHLRPPPVDNRVVDEIKQYEKLISMGATHFSGSTDPSVADTWLRRLEKVFNVMRCSDEKKLDFAVYLLKEDVENWWNTVKQRFPNPSTLTWNDFQKEILTQYYPQTYRKEKRNEFIYLK